MIRFFVLLLMLQDVIPVPLSSDFAALKAPAVGEHGRNGSATDSGSDTMGTSMWNGRIGQPPMRLGRQAPGRANSTTMSSDVVLPTTSEKPKDTSHQWIPWAVAAAILVGIIVMVGLIFLCVRRERRRRRRKGGVTVLDKSGTTSPSAYKSVCRRSSVEDSGDVSGDATDSRVQGWASVRAGLWAQKTIVDSPQSAKPPPPPSPPKLGKGPVVCPIGTKSVKSGHIPSISVKPSAESLVSTKQTLEQSLTAKQGKSTANVTIQAKSLKRVSESQSLMKRAPVIDADLDAALGKSAKGAASEHHQQTSAPSSASPQDHES